MKSSILCACVDGENRPDPRCQLGCMGTGLLCSRCLDKPGRWLDDRCPDCDGGRDLYAPLAPPTPESIRLGRELTILLAANAGT